MGRSPGKDLFQPLKANTVLIYNNTSSFLWSGFPLENVTVQLSGKQKKLTVSEHFYLALYCSYVLDHRNAQVRSHLCNRGENIFYPPTLPMISKSSTTEVRRSFPIFWMHRQPETHESEGGVWNNIKTLHVLVLILLCAHSFYYLFFRAAKGLNPTSPTNPLPSLSCSTTYALSP